MLAVHEGSEYKSSSINKPHPKEKLTRNNMRQLDLKPSASERFLTPVVRKCVLYLFKHSVT